VGPPQVLGQNKGCLVRISAAQGCQDRFVVAVVARLEPDAARLRLPSDLQSLQSQPVNLLGKARQVAIQY
jgi:hypothetical protein